MPVGFLVNGINSLIGNSRKRGKDKRGAEALDSMIKRVMAAQAPTPSTAQQQQMQREMDPILKMLAGGGMAGGAAPQHSPIPQGGPADPQAAAYAANAQDIQSAKRGTSGLDYLLAATDPVYAEQLKQLQQGTQRAEFDHQQVANEAMQDGESEAAWQQMLANPQNLPTNAQSSVNLLRAGGREKSTSTLLSGLLPNAGATSGGIGRISPNQYTPDSVQAFANSGSQGARDYSLLKKAPTTEVIGGITYSRNPITGAMDTLPIDQLGNMSDVKDAEASGTANAGLFYDLDNSRIGRKNSIDNLQTLQNAIQTGQLDTGIIEGRAQMPNEMKELLYSEQMKAARSELKAAGETRTTDADVEQMRQAMFGAFNTEKFNLRMLEQTLTYHQDQERKYQGLLQYRQQRNLQTPTAPQTPTATMRYNPKTKKVEAI